MDCWGRFLGSIGIKNLRNTRGKALLSPLPKAVAYLFLVNSCFRETSSDS